ncbi:AAA family ATPase [Rufibacter hautae]|uniref:ATP-binding protein n=1 Tax=Rufibacter hautae TaxID=2595005 RepID=A0A5B6TBF0_9BACT|nr:ATP-binding protein [Rufibacter hautae]KAA3436344.1 ATP-binding protein [Rufibacter hautae]
MVKIAITGPESTGKSTLSAQLAQHYNAPWVPEYARTYLDQLERPYAAPDLEAIARGQLALWQAEEARNPELLFLDTELLVLKIWSEHSYDICSSFILENLRRQNVDLYLLLDIDLPWTPDPQREHPHLRQFFHDWYKRELDQIDVPYVEISGSAEERLQNAIRAVNQVLHP